MMGPNDQTRFTTESFTMNRSRVSFLATLAIFVCTSSYGALVTLINVDITTPTAVVFTSTTGVSDVTDTSSVSVDGVTLEALFSTPPAGHVATMGGDLAPFAGGDTYDRETNLSTAANLNLYTNLGGTTQTFTFGIRAFTGSTTINLSTATFQAIGDSGNIRVGDTGAVLGIWIITGVVGGSVPEPSTFAMFALGCVGIVVARRRRVR